MEQFGIEKNRISGAIRPYMCNTDEEPRTPKHFNDDVTDYLQITNGCPVRIYGSEFQAPTNNPNPHLVDLKHCANIDVDGCIFYNQLTENSSVPGFGYSLYCDYCTNVNIARCTFHESRIGVRLSACSTGQIVGIECDPYVDQIISLTSGTFGIEIIGVHCNSKLVIGNLGWPRAVSAIRVYDCTFKGIDIQGAVHDVQFENVKADYLNLSYVKGARITGISKVNCKFPFTNDIYYNESGQLIEKSH